MRTINARSRTLASLATLSAALGLAAWSPAASACTSDPVMASICTMAFASGWPSFNNTYVLAAGQTLSISQNAALFSLLGTTYGGNGQTTFSLPDLRGRVIVGYDASNPSYAVGAIGGSAAINLTTAQLPQHVVPLNNVAVNLGNVQAATTLTGLSATANLSGVALKGAASGLTMKVASSTNGQNNPANNYLGRANGTAGNLYTNQAPDATLNPNAIGGELTLTVGNGVTAPVAITGAAQTTIGGSASVSGTSGVVGGGQPVPVMPPYLVLPYYIATSGIYPSRD